MQTSTPQKNLASAVVDSLTMSNQKFYGTYTRISSVAMLEEQPQINLSGNTLPVYTVYDTALHIGAKWFLVWLMYLKPGGATAGKKHIKHNVYALAYASANTLSNMAYTTKIFKN